MLFPKLNFFFFLLITLLTTGCNNKKADDKLNQTTDNQISFITKYNVNSSDFGNGECYVLYENKKNEKTIIDVFNCESTDMAGQNFVDDLYVDISNNKEVKSFPTPEYRGEIILKKAVIESKIVNNRGEEEIKINIYYVIQNKGRVTILKESWSKGFDTSYRNTEPIVIY